MIKNFLKNVKNPIKKKQNLQNLASEDQLLDSGFETIDIDKMVSEIGQVYNSNQGADIKLVNVSKKYEGNENYTLENINLEIKSGTFCIFLGPSGCGKTTLLRMIAGLNSITKGDLLFNSKRYNNLLPNERNIAMVFQSYALYPHMNVYNNIAFGLKIANERKDIIDRTVKDVAKILKIDKYLYRKPRDLSGGQRQRVAIGRAIARKPLVFLMDEPLSNLDAKLRVQTRQWIKKIQSEIGITTVFVTHDQEEAMSISDVIVCMSTGKIQQIGSPLELYNYPKNEFVAKFLGVPEMSIFTADLTDIKFSFLVDILAKRSIVYKQNKIRVGIRAEDLIETQQDKYMFKATIDSVEYLGKEILAKVVVDNVETFNIFLKNKENYKKNEEIFFNFSSSKLHLFDIETRERL